MNMAGIGSFGLELRVLSRRSRAPAAPRRLHGGALHLDGGDDVGGAGDGVGGPPPLLSV